MGSVDLPNSYLPSQSATEAAGLQPLYFTSNADSDYANSMDNRRIVTGYVNFLASGPGTWQSKTQQSVVLSTMEAKYMALAAEVPNVEHQKTAFDELGLPLMQPTIIQDDNRACQPFADHPGNIQKTKHIDVIYHFVREHIQCGSLRVDYVLTSENVADIFTKAIPQEPFTKFSSMWVVSRAIINFIA